MSNMQLIIEERAASIGQFQVGRLLPFRQKRSVGPFVFIDHMGPVQFKAREALDVLPHPHIGLSTLTFLFEGSITHRDSLGNELDIQPGAVNWMTAGRGVVHSERTPEALREAKTFLHGLQIWVALPAELEEMEPSFTHIPAESIPSWEEDGLSFKLIAGAFRGHQSPVPTHSPLYLIEIKSSQDQTIQLGDDLFGESGLYILAGGVVEDGQELGPKQILIAQDTTLCTFELKAHSTVYLFGGEPFPEPRYIDWNFVSSRKDRLKQAKEDWINQRFPSIPGESGFVPYPQLGL